MVEVIEYWRPRKKPNFCVALHLSSLWRTSKYAWFLRICAPWIWSFLLCPPFPDFLRDHQY